MGSLRWLLCVAAALGAGAAHAGPEAKPRADPAKEYAERAGKLAARKDPEGWLSLADFCEDHLLLDKRLEALRKAIAQDPDNAAAHARLDEAKSGKAWLPVDEAEAREAKEQQAKGLVFYGTQWVQPQQAEQSREEDRKAQGWPVELRIDTPHIALYSGCPLDFSRRMAGLLENEVGAYQRLYGEVWRPDPGFKAVKVYLFPDRESYEQVARSQAPSVPSSQLAGFYASPPQILFVAMQKVAARSMPALQHFVMATAAHEMSHALDNLMSGCSLGEPLWMQEGRADYFGYARMGRQVIPGAARFAAGLNNDQFLGDLERNAPASDLQGLLDMPQGVFMGTDVLTHYTLSWAFVHFLFHGEGGSHVAAFRAYLAGVTQDGSRDEFEKVVGKVEELEPGYRRYASEEHLPRAKAQRLK